MSALGTGRLLGLPAWLSFALVVALSTCAAAAGPCEGPILMRSDFNVLPVMWQTPGSNVSVLNGQLVMQPSQNGISRVSLDLGGGHDIEACVFAIFGEGHGGQAGLSVFAAGTEILFAIDDAGRAVVRKNGSDTNGWVDLVPPRADPAIAPKFEFNQLTVKINGGNATFSVNDVELAAVKEAIPDGPLTLSIDAASDAEAVSTWRFDELTVTADPIIAAIAQTAGGPPGLLDALVDEAPGCGGAPILSDDFTAQPNGPLATDPALAVAAGKLDMTLVANGDHFVSWPVAGGRDIDACATVALADGTGSDASLNISGANGAVLFDVDPQHGVAGIYFRDAATDALSSLVKKRWMPALRRDAGAENTLHVRMREDRAIFYVNGAKFDSVEGLPKDLLSVELEGLAGQGGATWAFDDLKVTPSQPMVAANTQTPSGPQAIGPVAAKPAAVAAKAPSSATTEVAGTTTAPPAPSAQPAAAVAEPAATAVEPAVVVTEPQPAPTGPAAVQITQVGPPSCVTQAADIDRLALTIYDVAQASMLKDAQAAGPVNTTAERQIDGWEYCEAEATPLPQSVEISSAEAKITVEHPHDLPPIPFETDFGAAGLLRLFTAEKVQTAYDQVLRQDLGAPAFHLYLDVEFRYPFADLQLFDDPPIKRDYSIRDFDFPVKITVDGTEIVNDAPYSVASHPAPQPDLNGKWSDSYAWRFDLTKYGLSRDVLPPVHTIEASFKVPDQFRASDEEVVFYRANLTNTAELFAAMDRYQSEEARKPLEITEAMRKAQLLKDAQRQCPNCKVEASTDPESAAAFTLGADEAQLRVIDGRAAPNDIGECMSMADQIWQTYSLLQPAQSSSGSAAPNEGIGEALALQDVGDVEDLCRANEFGQALRATRTLVHNMLDPQIDAIKEAPILKSIDEMRWPENAEECLSLAQRTADLAAQASGGRDETNIQVVTRIEGECRGSSFPAAGTDAQEEMRRLVKTRHIVGKLQ